MTAKSRILRAILMVLGLLAAAMFIVAVSQQGIALFDMAMSRLWLVGALLTVGLGCLAFVALAPGNGLLRLFATLALVAALGTLLVSGGLWYRDMRRTIEEVQMRPVEPGRIGILVAGANHSADAIAEARAIEADLQYFNQKTGLEPYVSVHHVYPLRTLQQARTLAERLGAHVVVWKTQTGRDPIDSVYHITVLGANETDLQMVPPDLLRTMAMQTDLVFRYSLPRDADSQIQRQAVAQVAAGFGGLAVGRPMIAAAQFKTVLDSGTVPTDTLGALQAQYAGALLALDRADLAVEAYKQALRISEHSDAYVGLGNALLVQRDWEAAARAFDRAVAVDPYGQAGYCGLGLVYARQRNVQRASAVFDQAIGLAPDEPVPYALRAYAYELEGRVEAAQEAYRQSALRAGPNQALMISAENRASYIGNHPPTAVPTATPVPTIAPTPVPTSAIYVVKSGETLGIIAEKLGVEIDALVELNDLPNADTISIGQALLIPQEEE